MPVRLVRATVQRLVHDKFFDFVQGSSFSQLVDDESSYPDADGKLAIFFFDRRTSVDALNEPHCINQLANDWGGAHIKNTKSRNFHSRFGH
nr:hypothetical protein [Caldalkalibacillus uzonensis]